MLGNCKPSDNSACKTHPTNTHLEKQFGHPKIAKLQKGTFAKWFLDEEKQSNETCQAKSHIPKIRKSLADEMNTRFRTAKPLEKHTIVLLTNQTLMEFQKLLPLKPDHT